MSVSIRKIEKTYAVSGGYQQVLADLDVSTIEELPHIGDIVDSCAIMANSIADVTQIGKFVKLDTNDKWYYRDNGGEVTAEEPASLSMAVSPRTLDDPVLRNGDDEIRTEFEPFPEIEETEPTETEPEVTEDER